LLLHARPPPADLLAELAFFIRLAFRKNSAENRDKNYLSGDAMKACGIIRGKFVELEESPGLPDGQRVEVELTPVVEDPVLAAAVRIRERLLHRWKKPLNLSLEFLREDRAR
jgi:hypothetical protein